jgi:hypothetical protein
MINDEEPKSVFRELLDAMADANHDYRVNPTHQGRGEALRDAVEDVLTYLQADASDRLHDAIDEEGT